MKALSIPSRYGPDIDVNMYSPSRSSYASVTEEMTLRALDVGVTAEGRAGTYFQVDSSTVKESVEEMYHGKVEISSIKEALRNHTWLKEYYWKAVDPAADKYTATAYFEGVLGYFIRIREGEKVDLPVQSCLYMASQGGRQVVHNIIVAEPGSEAHLITGCVTGKQVDTGLHIGVSEFYVGRDAHLTFTMFHDWGRNLHVRPRTGIILENGASFTSNYILLRPVGSVQTYPYAFCSGDSCAVRFTSLIYGASSSIIDVGAKAILKGEDSKAEIISRVIATEHSKIYARGLLKGLNKSSRGHLECSGLLLSENAEIHAIPELQGIAMGANLTHEAAIGKIAEEEIQYLMARGLSEEEATSLLIRGFMDVEILGLPPHLTRQVDLMISKVLKGAF